MKRIIFTLLITFTLSFTISSCKSEKKEEVKKEMATQVYQCPMDCEHGKSYTKPGKCPVCKMDLKAKKAGEKHDHKEGDNHNH